MELFIPSVLILLLAAAVIFFILPRFGAPVLALISVGLLIYGLYEHINAFSNEYRLSTWQYDYMTYAPYIMVGGLLVVIAFYLVSISPFGKATPTAPSMPTVAEMPNASTATNVVTAGVNNALKGAKNIAGNIGAAIGLGNAAKNGNNKGNIANTAVNGVKKAANNIGNTLSGALNTLAGNNNNNNNNNNSSNNKGTRVPGINFPLSQV